MMVAAVACTLITLSGSAEQALVDLPDGMVLIVHRGVVSGAITENSLPALEASIERGYTHMEVDIRCTKDGVAVCLHDRNLRRTTGIDRNIDEITLAELRDLVDKETVPTLAEFAARSEGRIGIMPDVKQYPGPLHAQFAESIEEALSSHGLLEDAYFIGAQAIKEHFRGRGKSSFRLSYAEAKEIAAENPGIVEEKFIFGHAEDFGQAEVEGLQSLGFEVIVSINTFHYKGGDAIEQGLADIRAMAALGVDGLQIDSVYDHILFPQN